MWTVKKSLGSFVLERHDGMPFMKHVRGKLVRRTWLNRFSAQCFAHSLNLVNQGDPLAVKS